MSIIPFLDMKIEMSTTQMVNIFNKDNRFILLKNAIKAIDDNLSQSIILIYLDPLNLIVKAIVLVMKKTITDKDFISNYFFDFYLNYLSKKAPNSNLLALYKELYKNELIKDILDYWNELKNNDNPLIHTRNFIKTFDEIHDYALVKYPTLFIKNGKGLKNLYRCAKGDHYGDYKRLFPNDDFADRNRWNHPNMAYLYVGYDENNASLAQIDNIKKTCFEEIRLKDKQYATLCKFKITSNCKLLNLYIDSSSVDQVAEELDSFSNNQIMELFSNDQLIEQCKNLLYQNKTKEFKEKLKKYISPDKTIVEKFISSLLVSIIVESIFVPIDEHEDPDLETYIPFRIFADYLKTKGYDGIIYKSTRMDLIGLKGKNIVIFDKNISIPCEGTMELYKRENGQDIKIK